MNSQRACIIQANNFLRLGIESAKAADTLTSEKLQELTQLILQENNGVQDKSQEFYILQRQYITAMFPHCLHSNLPTLGEGINTLANAFNVGGTNCFFKAENITINSASDFATAAKHPGKYIQQAAAAYKNNMQINGAFHIPDFLVTIHYIFLFF